MQSQVSDNIEKTSLHIEKRSTSKETYMRHLMYVQRHVSETCECIRKETYIWDITYAKETYIRDLTYEKRPIYETSLMKRDLYTRSHLWTETYIWDLTYEKRPSYTWGKRSSHTYIHTYTHTHTYTHEKRPSYTEVRSRI